MNEFKTSRVVVIDDMRDEALPVIEALGRMGVGCIYLPGERLEDLPKDPLRGIRLVILDMRLGTTGGEKQTASMTANVFRRVISPDDGPLIVLLWTKHKDDVPAFQKALFAFDPNFRATLLIADLEKPAKITPGTLRKVLKRIASLAQEWAPMDFLWSWEQIAHNAATSTTGMVANHVSANAAIVAADDEEQRKVKWLRALKQLLRRLVEGAGGSGAGAATAQEDLLEALIAIQSDRIEMEAGADRSSNLATIFADAPGGLTKMQTAQLNGMLLLGAASPKPQELRPGNAYLLDVDPAKRGFFRGCGIDVADLSAEILSQFDADTEFKALGAEMAKAEINSEARKAMTQKRAIRKSALIAQCHPFVVEISPSCDFTQRTRHVVRLATGLLVPAELEKIIPGKKESLRPLEIVQIPNLKGLWKPVFSGRFLFTVVDPQKCLKFLPTFRLRTQVLADLRNWYASQSARPGYLSIPA